MSFYVYRAMSGAGGVGSRALGGPIGASGVSESPVSFDLRGSSWFPLDKEGPIVASETWLLHAGLSRPLTEVILIQIGWLTR